MKRTLALILAAVIFGATLASCSGGTANQGAIMGLGSMKPAPEEYEE